MAGNVELLSNLLTSGFRKRLPHCRLILHGARGLKQSTHFSACAKQDELLLLVGAMSVTTNGAKSHVFFSFTWPISLGHNGILGLRVNFKSRGK